MAVDSTQSLIAQFSGFISSKDISKEDWEIVTKEFGVYDIAKNTERFFRSWYFDDDDKALRTTNFLENIHEEDSELTKLLISRVYTRVGSASSAEFEKYPMVRVIEDGIDNETSLVNRNAYNSDPFIEIENLPDSFYPELVEEINSCYQNGSYTATLILCRKLLENASIEVLRARFGIENGMYLFFDDERGQFIQFSQLISNLNKEIGNFEPLSDGADEELTQQLHEIRYQSNAGAHSLEKSITKDKVDEFKNSIGRTAVILFDLRRKSLDEDNISPTSESEKDVTSSTELDKENFQVSDSELLKTHLEDVNDQFRFSDEGDLHINGETEKSLKDKVRIHFLAYQYASEVELVESPVISVNDLIESYDSDMGEMWGVINNLDCLKDVNRTDGEFMFNVQKLPEVKSRI